MRAIILAAGRGSRLAPKTDSLPKCMTPLWGKALLDWQIETLRSAGVSEIGIVVGYKSEMILREDVHYFHNSAWEQGNILISLLSARSWLENYDCIIAYSDILYTPNTIKMLKNSPEEISITYNTNFLELWNKRFQYPLSDLESFKVNNKNQLVDIGHKTKTVEEIEGQYMGLLKTSPDGFRKTDYVLRTLDQKTIKKLDITGLFKILLNLKIHINTIPCSDFWIEIDSLHDLELYETWEERGFLIKENLTEKISV